MEEIIPGYNEAREKLIEQLSEPMDQYILCQLKLQQLNKKGIKGQPHLEIANTMMFHKDQIAEILLQNIEIQPTND